MYFIFSYVSAFACVHTSALAWLGQKRKAGHLVVEVVMSYHMWMLGTELRSFRKAIYALNH